MTTHAQGAATAPPQGRYYVDSEPGSPFARYGDKDVLWRVRDTRGRPGQPWTHPVVYRGRSERDAAEHCQRLNERG